MKKLSGLILFTLIVLSTAMSQGAQQVLPIKTTWAEAIGVSISMDYFDYDGEEYSLVGNPIDLSLDILVYQCPGNVLVVVEEDISTILNDGLAETQYFDLIYILDDNIINYTSYPEGYACRVEYKGAEIFITVSYLIDGKSFKAKLHYAAGEVLKM
ncbi:MAG: hypothetical protein C0592_09715 [Marinilabiliales bacterium]|nr:MAG: hypothetical protein C0592_09715 [Marinilabiliales bacterium]